MTKPTRRAVVGAIEMTTNVIPFPLAASKPAPSSDLDEAFEKIANIMTRLSAEPVGTRSWHVIAGTLNWWQKELVNLQRAHGGLVA